MQCPESFWPSPRQLDDEMKGREVLDWVIRPYEAFGPLRFGMTIDEIVAVLGEPKIFGTEVAYPDFGIKIELDRETRECRSVSGWYPPCSPSINRISLVGDYDAVVSNLFRAGYSSLYQDTGVGEGAVYCEDVGVGVWCEDEDSQQIVGVLAYAKDYWPTELRTSWVPLTR